MKRIIAFFMTLLMIATVFSATAILLSAEDVLYGDVNKDDSLAIGDLTYFKNYFSNYDSSEGTSSVSVDERADCNGDGKITLGDLTRLKYYFANYDESAGSSTITLGPVDAGQRIVYFADGVKVKNIADGDYVCYVDEIGGDVFNAWDYSKNEILNFDGTKDYTVYAFSVSKLYDSISALKSDKTLKKGDIVGVKSYQSGKNKGAGIWKIADSGSTSKGDQQLSNGLYAELVPFEVKGKSIITVDQFGSPADGVNSDSYYINIALGKEVDVIEFEGKTYIQTNLLTLSRGNVTVDGNGAQISNNYDKASVPIGYDFNINGSATKPLEHITIKNLELYCAEEKGAGYLYQQNDHIQFRAVNTKYLTVKNCKFIVPEEGDTERHVDSIWVNGVVKHLTLEDNYIFNYSDSGLGGGIWISTSATSYDDPAEDIIVRNNRVIKNTGDEVFALFIGYFDGVLVENNYFETKDHAFATDSDCKNGIGIGVWDIETHCKNVKFLNNEARLCLQSTAFVFSHTDGVEMAGNKVYVYEMYTGTGNDTKLGLNNIFRMSEGDKVSVNGLNVHDNYFEVNVGKVEKRSYDIESIELGIKSGSFKNNEFVINGRLNKVLNDSIEFVDNTITVNGSINNNNAPAGNTVKVK